MVKPKNLYVKVWRASPAANELEIFLAAGTFYSERWKFLTHFAARTLADVRSQQETDLRKLDAAFHLFKKKSYIAITPVSYISARP